MKGQYSYLLGLLVTLLGLAIFTIHATFKTGDQVNIASGSVEVFSSMHAAEKLKRAIEAAATVDSELAVRELAEKGGGFTTWGNSTPTEAQLAGQLEAGLRGQLRKFDVEGLEGRLIDWGSPVAKVERVTNRSFAYRGQRPFSITSKLVNPEVQLSARGAFEGVTGTSYFKLAAEGRGLAKQCASISLGEKKAGALTTQIANVSKGDQLMYAVNITNTTEPLRLGFTLNCTGA